MCVRLAPHSSPLPICLLLAPNYPTSLLASGRDRLNFSDVPNYCSLRSPVSPPAPRWNPTQLLTPAHYSPTHSHTHPLTHTLLTHSVLTHAHYSHPLTTHTHTTGTHTHPHYYYYYYYSHPLTTHTRATHTPIPRQSPIVIVGWHLRHGRLAL